MKVVFVTTNQAKFDQAKKVFGESGIELEHNTLDYPEHQELSIPEISKEGAKFCANHLNAPCMVDDTGMFFDAYPGFPGPLSKTVFKMLGFDGLYRLLDGKERTAYFMASCAYCEPGKEAISFEGIMRGTVVEELPTVPLDNLPYDACFIPDGADKILLNFSAEDRMNFPNHHRRQAFAKLIEHLHQKS